ncbi:hypothetical protein Leryth_014397 [Lithospermum erythrorhizon]|nr:hypothetical protein Leryth_014397 [Lithospermum erythrorhizon]
MNCEMVVDLVIEQTEALVSIDVNGGHCMLGQGTSQEKAILDVNLAAAKQIARELRLRDIDMMDEVDYNVKGQVLQFASFQDHQL